MNIEHIVISGGGPVGLSQFGSYKFLIDNNYIEQSKIKSIYATSVGCFIAIMIALNMNLNDMKEYIIERPWEKTFEVKPSTAIYNIINYKGIFNNDFFKTIIEPVLSSKKIDLNITFDEFYKLTNIDIHFITSEVNSLSSENLCYKNNPELKIIDALHMSCSIPLLITPYNSDNKYYIDGGLTNNYPLNLCINEYNIENTDCILGFKNMNDIEFIKSLNFNSSLSDVFSTVIRKFSFMIHDKSDINIKHCLNIYTKGVNVSNMSSLLNKETRKKLVNDGVVYTRLFLEYHNLI